MAGVQPTKTPRVSGTKEKLRLRRRPKKALKQAGEIKSRSDKFSRDISQRQKMPSKRYRKELVPQYKRKTQFLHRGEAVERLSTLCATLRTLVGRTDDGSKTDEEDEGL